MAEPSESGLSGQLVRIEKKLDDLEAASRRNKVTSRVISLAIAIVAVLMVWLMVDPLVGAVSKPESKQKYQKALSRSFEERLRPRVEEEAFIMFHELKPVYTDAFNKVREERSEDVIAALEKEANILITNVGSDIQTQMDEFQHEFETHQLERLKKEFPQLADEDKAADIVEKAASATEKVVERLVVDLFAEHHAALARLETEFNQIDVPEEIQQMSPDEIEEHVSALVFELMTIKLNELRTGESVVADVDESTTTAADVINLENISEDESGEE